MANLAEKPVPHRRRFLLGLALAGALVGIAGLGLLGAANVRTARETAERSAGVTLQALADLIGKAGGGTGPATEAATGGGINDELGGLDTPGGGIGSELDAATGEAPASDATDAGARVRDAVARFAAAHPEVSAIRVVTFDGILLEASTDPADSGEHAAPRKLEREEKPLYDLGQKLRAAVEGNRETGEQAGARAEEVDVARSEDGTLVLSTPLERDGAVAGLIQLAEKPAADPAHRSSRPILPALLTAISPAVALFLLALLARGLGNRRRFLAPLAVILLAAGTWGFVGFASRSLSAQSQANAQAIAARVQAERAGNEKLAGELGLPADFDAARWDVDLYRQPLGWVDAAGAVDSATLAAETVRSTGRTNRALAVVFCLALVLLGFVGFGSAARTIENLISFRVAYAYTLPAIFGMLFLVFLPFLYGVALSFTNRNLYNTNKPIWDIWIGLANFADILGDFHVYTRTAEGLVWNYHNFYWTFGFTVVWTIANVTIGVTLGLLLALALNTKGLAFRPFYRVLLILPWAMPNYITALIWKGMFHPQFGVINQVIQMFGGSPVAWFDQPLTSFAAVLSTNGWLSFPFMMVISLGALQSISADLYEAARVDGASRWQQFKAITLPSLKPALVPAIIISVIWTFNQFNIIYLVSVGEPGGATEILVTQAYKLAFEQYRYGYAAAYSVVIFLVLFAYGNWQNRVTGASEGN